MMFKSVNLKRLLAAQVCIVTMIFICACGREIKSTRNITVDELNGSALVAAEGSDGFEAYKGMQLVSGEVVNVDSDSDMTLKIDEDKHFFAGSDTRFSIEATGKKDATETKIVLAEGSVLVGIDNKLKDAESFELVTPNATMAVRGTVFKVEVTNASGTYYTKLEVLEGTVESTTVENGETRSEAVTEGGNAIYTGTAPIADWPEQPRAESTSSIKSMKDIPSDRDGSKGFAGVYRGDGYCIVIAEGVPFAYNRVDGIIVDDKASKPFCLAQFNEYSDEPFFARDAEKKSDTLITDYTYRDDRSAHVVDTEYYLDGDTLYYHYIYNEQNAEEFALLQRTDEDPVSVYMSCVRGNMPAGKDDGKETMDAGGLKTSSGIPVEEYLADIDREGITISGQVYGFDEYYKGNPQYNKAKKEHRVWGSTGYIVVLSSPVTYDGHTITACACGFDEVIHTDIQDRALNAGNGQLFGYFNPGAYKPSDSADITEEVMGSPVYMFSVMECK